MTRFAAFGSILLCCVCLLPLPAQTNGSKPGLPDAATLERRLYFTSLNLIEREYALNHTARVLELLEETKSSPNRGFEWGYWSAQCRQEKTRFSAADSHLVGGITALAWTSDSKSLLSASGADRRVLVRDAKTGKITSSVALKGGFNNAVFSPDAKRIATVGGYVVTICDVETGERISETKRPQEVLRSEIAADFSSDGKQVVTAGLDGWAHLFDAASGAEIHQIKDRGLGSFYSVAISPDGKWFGSGDDGNFAWIWSTTDGATLHQLKGHTSGISTETFSPDGKQFASGSWDCTIKLWDTASGAEMQTLRGHTGVITCLRYTPDGKRIFTASSDGTVKMWNAQTGALLRDLRGHTSAIGVMALSPDGKLLATGSNDGDTMLWDASATGEPGIPPVDEATITVNNTKASKLPFRLFGIGIKVPPLSWDGTLAVRPVGANAEVWQVLTGVKQCMLEGNGANITLVAISQDKTRIATTNENTVNVWDALTGKRLFSLEGHAAPVGSVAFSEDSHMLVSGSADATAKVWDITTGKLLYTLRGQTGDVFRVGFQCSDRFIVTASKDGFARVWEKQSGRLLCSLDGQAGAVGGLKISPDGRHIVIDYGTIALWNAVTGKKITDLQGIRADNAHLAFSPDSRRLIVGSFGGYARMYETEAGRDLLTFNLNGESRWVTTVAFSADGNRLDLYNAALPPVSFHAK